MRYVIVVMLLLMVGCESTDETDQAALMTSIPLEFDPTEKYELASWWSNDEQLLHLDRTGFYRLYKGTNRYRGTAERGRWWQQSYAALWLEPYSERPQEPTRVSIRKSDDGFTIELRDLEEMKALDEPPAVLEDRLIGTWRGAFGRLTLGSDSRYVYSPAAPPRSTPAVVAGHQGDWRIEDKMLLLLPDSPATEPIALSVSATDETAVLRSSAGLLRRVAFVPVEG